MLVRECRTPRVPPRRSGAGSVLGAGRCGRLRAEAADELAMRAERCAKRKEESQSRGLPEAGAQKPVPAEPFASPEQASRPS